MADAEQPNVTTLTVQLLSAYFANNTVASAEIADLVRATKVALLEDVMIGAAQSDASTYTPAVSVRKSLASPDHILSLIDGKPYKTLKRHLSRHDLTPQTYRERYGLAADYPMVAPSFAAKRRAIAEKIGLGRRPAAAVSPTDAPASTVASTDKSPKIASVETPSPATAASKVRRSSVGAAVSKEKAKNVARKTASQTASARASKVSTKPSAQKSTGRVSVAKRQSVDDEPSAADETGAKGPNRPRRGTLKLFPEKRGASTNSNRKITTSPASGENPQTGTMPAPEGSQASRGRSRKSSTPSSDT